MEDGDIYPANMYEHEEIEGFDFPFPPHGLIFMLLMLALLALTSATPI
ncbi:MAG: hypothetical protein KBC16_00320 [Candidatus Pacebacteria bacterium]|nr:hypothetical protein [Candidatus Paceibacterota bacterium]